LSGWELTRTLKNDPRYRNIPIIMFSALDDAKDKVEGFELGIDDYITKPFNFSEVLARIRTVLRNREFYTQILARESRLRLAEEFSADMRRHLVDLVKSIDELDAVIAEISSDEGETKRTHEISKKSRSVRKYIAELDERIEKVVSEWGRLKKMEISLPNLEARFSASINATAASVDPADTVSADAVSASA
jgi:response regulator RpfG family c-di-GMP phosphodiesterase